MTWTPVTTLTVAGVDLAPMTLSGLTVTRGRTRVSEQPQPGYLNASLVYHDAPPAAELNSEVVVTLEDSSGTPVTLFTGWLTDLVTSVTTVGTVATEYAVDLVAVGILSKLSRAEVGADGFPVELDGARIATVLGDGLAVRWDTVDPSLTWDAVDPATTWAGYSSPYVGTIDPGVYGLAAIDPTITNAYSLAANAANAGDGVLIERTDGTVDYEDSAARQARLTANGWTLLPAGDAVAGGITTTRRTGELVNRAYVTYGTGDDAAQADAEASLSTYGIYARSYDFALANLTDAQARADRLVELYGDPRDNLEGVSFPLVTLTDPDVDLMLGLDVGTPIELTPLPPGILGGDSWTGWVEGVSFIISRTSAAILLYVSDGLFSVYPTRWADVFATKTWTDVGTADPTLTWAKAYGPALEAA